MVVEGFGRETVERGPEDTTPGLLVVSEPLVELPTQSYALILNNGRGLEEAWGVPRGEPRVCFPKLVREGCEAVAFERKGHWNATCRLYLLCKYPGVCSSDRKDVKI